MENKAINHNYPVLPLKLHLEAHNLNDKTTRIPIWGTKQGTVMRNIGYVIGFKNNKIQLRLDYDEENRLHININDSNGNSLQNGPMLNHGKVQGFQKDKFQNWENWTYAYRNIVPQNVIQTLKCMSNINYFDNQGQIDKNAYKQVQYAQKRLKILGHN